MQCAVYCVLFNLEALFIKWGSFPLCFQDVALQDISAFCDFRLEEMSWNILEMISSTQT